jgi:hypothetical protein
VQTACRLDAGSIARAPTLTCFFFKPRAARNLALIEQHGIKA